MKETMQEKPTIGMKIIKKSSAQTFMDQAIAVHKKNLIQGETVRISKREFTRLMWRI